MFKYRLHVSLASLCVARFLDQLTTDYGLAHGLMESNPYFNVSLGMVLAVTSMCLIDFLVPNRYGDLFLLEFGVLPWVAVVNNAILLNGLIPIPYYGTFPVSILILLLVWLVKEGFITVSIDMNP